MKTLTNTVGMEIYQWLKPLTILEWIAGSQAASNVPILSFFTGLGLLDLGFGKVGFESVWEEVRTSIIYFSADDFTATVTSTLLGVVGQKIDAMESGINTLEFRTDLLVNNDQVPIIENPTTIAALSRRYRVRISGANVIVGANGMAYINNHVSEQKVYSIGGANTEGVFPYTNGRKPTIFMFYDAAGNKNKEEIKFEDVQDSRITKVYARLGSTVTAEVYSPSATIAKCDIKLTRSDFLLLWKTVALNANRASMENEKAYPFKVFIDDAQATLTDGVWGVEKKNGTDFGSTQDAEVFVDLTNAMEKKDVSGVNGSIYTGYFVGKKPGEYRVSFKYKLNSPLVPILANAPGNFHTVTVVDARLASTLPSTDQMLVGGQAPDLYGIMPSRYFSASTQNQPDKQGNENWKLAGTSNPSLERRFAKGAGTHSLKFGDTDFVAIAMSTDKKQVAVTPATNVLEGEGPLKTSKTQGHFYINGEANAWMALDATTSFILPSPTGNFISAKILKSAEYPTGLPTTDVSGTIDPLLLIMPDIGIAKPTGDPTAGGAGGADADNEAVFDDSTPTGEVAGKCLVKLEANPLGGLSTASREKVWSICTWTAPAVGATPVPLAYTPVSMIGQKVDALYGSMPAKPDDFGLKRITMAFGTGRYKYYQRIEFFFHYEGTGGRVAPNDVPNWFFYWKQIRAAVKGAGNPSIIFRPGTGISSGWATLGANSIIAIIASDADSLSGYIGILAHEQKHENDFWEVIWGGTGYKVADDRDHDFLNDDWERTQQMAPGTGHGPWTFSVLAYGGLPAVVGTNTAQGRDNDAAFETEQTFFSWSDDRADIAAKDAVDAVNIVNGNPGIDAQDWSDKKVVPGNVYSFDDEDDLKQLHKQTCNPTTSGNNKQF